MSTLSATEYRMLSVLSNTEVTGRDVGAAYEKEFGAISYGTLYTTLSRLCEKGYVRARDDNDADGRVRHFSITMKGIAAFTAERADYAELAAIQLSIQT